MCHHHLEEHVRTHHRPSLLLPPDDLARLFRRFGPALHRKHVIVVVILLLLFFDFHLFLLSFLPFLSLHSPDPSSDPAPRSTRTSRAVLPPFAIIIPPLHPPLGRRDLVRLVLARQRGLFRVGGRGVFLEGEDPGCDCS